MLRVLGGALVLLASGSFGITAGVRYYRAARHLQAFCRAIELLRCEINYSLQPLPEVMAVLELCSALGRYDLDGENRMLDLTAKRLQAALARCEAEKRPRAKCYAALGLCTGLALLILAV